MTDDDQQLLAQIVEMRAEGLTFEAIGAKLARADWNAVASQERRVGAGVSELEFLAMRGAKTGSSARARAAAELFATTWAPDLSEQWRVRLVRYGCHSSAEVERLLAKPWFDLHFDADERTTLERWLRLRKPGYRSKAGLYRGLTRRALFAISRCETLAEVRALVRGPRPRRGVGKKTMDELVERFGRPPAAADTHATDAPPAHK